MILYIYLLVHQTVIYCAGGECTQVSMAHFNYIFGLGVLELLLEIPGVVKIFQKINKATPPDEPDTVSRTKITHRKIDD